MKALVFIAGLLSAPMPAQAQPYLSVSLCDLHTQAQAMAGKEITFSALYETDRRHGAALTAAACPDVQFAPYLDRDAPDKASLDAFEAAVLGDPGDISLRRFSIIARARYAGFSKTDGKDKIIIDKVIAYKRQ